MWAALFGAAALVGAACPKPVQAESALGSQSATAQVRITVLVPPMLHLVGNHHPDRLEAAGEGRWQGVQLLTFRTNLRTGACIGLNQQSSSAAWGVQAMSGPVRLEGDRAGYRVCSVGPGLVTAELRHVFEGQVDQGVPPVWPVMVSASSY